MNVDFAARGYVGVLRGQDREGETLLGSGVGVDRDGEEDRSARDAVGSHG